MALWLSGLVELGVELGSISSLASLSGVELGMCKDEDGRGSTSEGFGLCVPVGRSIVASPFADDPVETEIPGT